MGRMNTPADVWENVDQTTDPSGCWEWLGYKQQDGYGKIGFGRFSWRAHRLIWTFVNGPIPPGMLICHHCDNPSCCNPKHLFMGTQLDNMYDAALKGRLRIGRSTNHIKRGTPEEQAALMTRYS